MPSGRILDRQAFHEFLTSKAGRGGKLVLHQRELALEYGIASSHLSRVVKELVADGKMKLIGTGHQNVKTYLVRPWAESLPGS